MVQEARQFGLFGQLGEALPIRREIVAGILFLFARLVYRGKHLLKGYIVLWIEEFERLLTPYVSRLVLNIPSFFERVIQ